MELIVVINVFLKRLISRAEKRICDVYSQSELRESNFLKYPYLFYICSVREIPFVCDV